MTASLPVPNDIDPEEPDRHSGARVVRLANTVPPAPDKPRRPPRKPRSDKGGARAPRGARKDAPQPDPGPPPPLPSDLELAASAAASIIVPPRPPLPPTPGDIAPLADSAVKVDAEPVVESAPVAEPAAAVEPAPEAVDDAEPAASAPAVLPPAPAAPSTPNLATVAPPAPPKVAPPPVPPVPVAPAPASEPDGLPASTAGSTPTAPPESASADEDAAAAASVLSAMPPLAAPAGDALVLRGVTKRFGSTHAVDGIDLTVPTGTFYGLVGPNGAGKTTTLSMIAGLLEPDRGTIHIGGVDAAAKPLAAKKLMGVLPDRLRTFDRLTGRQLLYYYGVLRKLPPAVVESRTADLARAFDLEDALGRSVSDYSAGMLKKVMLAGALIHSPRLLVLDEPFEAVDPVSSSIILDILSAYVAHGGTVILSSHGMELVERVCTRVAVIVAGQVLAEGTVAEVRGELTLEQRFVELAGGLSDVEGLEWLHTFSD